jgi:hypothetical protein
MPGCSKLVRLSLSDTLNLGKCLLTRLILFAFDTSSLLSPAGPRATSTTLNFFLNDVLSK